MNLPEPIARICDEGTYQLYLAELAALMLLDPPLDTPDGQRLNALADVLVAYEAEQNWMK